jgi:hypothetical protein
MVWLLPVSSIDLAARGIGVRQYPTPRDPSLDEVMNKQVVDLTKRFDDIVLQVLEPIHMRKQIDSAAMGELKKVLDELGEVLRHEEYVPRKLVGDLWFVFTSILGEADHSKDPEPLRMAAWDIQERLRRIFWADLVSGTSDQRSHSRRNRARACLGGARRVWHEFPSGSGFAGIGNDGGSFRAAPDRARPPALSSGFRFGVLPLGVVIAMLPMRQSKTFTSAIELIRTASRGYGEFCVVLSIGPLCGRRDWTSANVRSVRACRSRVACHRGTCAHVE